MKKIMFNDTYSLTQAVLNGRKTQTRRIIKPQPTLDDMVGISWKGHSYGINSYPPTNNGSYYSFIKTLKYNKDYKGYKVGEVVAVSQCYSDVYEKFKSWDYITDGIYVDDIGWNNKMFVGAIFMPHQIRITGIGIERLQDISDEDCIKEGIFLNTKRIDFDGKKIYSFNKFINNSIADVFNFSSPREAYAALIDKISGKGTWGSNPYVFVYEFELIK